MIVRISITIADPFPPPSIAYVILALIVEDSRAMEPREKSNLPEFRFTESASVVIITMAV